MCGRYANSRRREDLVEVFEADLPASDGSHLESQSAPEHPQYNIAPTDTVPVVLARGRDDGSIQRLLVGARWGLVPHWAKDLRAGARLINARAESVLDKPAFARAVATRRVLLPADGWYEWQRTERAGKPVKQPFFLHRADNAVLAMAGVCAYWRDPLAGADGVDGRAGWVRTVAVITTAAESALTGVHDRMPLHLPADRWARWLDPAVTDRDDVAALLAAPPAGLVDAYRVHQRVGRVSEDDPGLTEPVGDQREHVQPTLPG